MKTPSILTRWLVRSTCAGLLCAALGAVATPVVNWASVTITGGSITGLSTLVTDGIVVAGDDDLTIGPNTVDTGGALEITASEGVSLSPALGIASGGTGASTAAGARSELGCNGVVQFNSGVSTSWNPGDGATYYIGAISKQFTPGTAGNSRPVYVAAGKITGAKLYMYPGNAGVSSETVTFYIRVNDTTDYEIGTAAFSASAGGVTTLSNTSMNVTVAAGDYIEIKMACPTFATNPTNVAVWGSVFTQ
jgi:hypothetical protein